MDKFKYTFLPIDRVDLKNNFFNEAFTAQNIFSVVPSLKLQPEASENMSNTLNDCHIQ